MADHPSPPPSLDPSWAWQPYVPSPESPWDLRKVGHLYRRAAFGTTWDELQEGLRAGPGPTIERLLKGGPGLAAFDEQTDSLTGGITRTNDAGQLRAWWLYRMLYTPHPLREKMTLFWHNHFATSNAKVNRAAAMLGQYRLMSRHALGRFGPMLQEMSRDPAMMVWLDTSLSKKGMPNENYARELMELFSLGIGPYTEQDIREAARAFTGWEVREGQAVFDTKNHDDGAKTVLGQKGAWKGEDVVRICLGQPAAPRFVAAKLFRFLVSESVPATPALVEPLAARLRQTDFDVGDLTALVLRSNLFFAPVVYRTRIRPPVDFVLGMIRGLEGRVGTTALAAVLEELGQNVFYPPSVKGWDGGTVWLNGQTLLARQNLALALTSTEDIRFGRRTDPAALVKKHGVADGQVAAFFLKLFLDDEVPGPSRQKLAEYEKNAGRAVPAFWTPEDAAAQRVRALCRLVLALPEYQLA